jgi:hypothetical protein
MIGTIILSVVLIAMLIVTKNMAGQFQKFITITLAISFLISFTGIRLLATIGLIIYTLAPILAVAYVFVEKHLSLNEKILIGLTGLLVFVNNTFALFHWPYANQIKALMIIPIIAYIILLAKEKGIFKREIGFMTILATICVLKFTSLWI